MPSSTIHGRGRSNRIVTKKCASLVITLSGVQKMFACLIVDRSQEGFRLRGNFRLRRGPLLELLLDDAVDSLPVGGIWVGQPEAQKVGEGWFANTRHTIL